MITNTLNLDILLTVASGLGELIDRVVFVGGAVVELYVDEESGNSPFRPTNDVDFFVEIHTFAQLVNFQELLAQKQFYPASDQNVICRFRYKEVLVDVMSTTEIGWAPANKWFASGYKSLQKIALNSEISISVLSFPYFLATKFAAYHDRASDPRTSQDFEDIVYVLDNRSKWYDEILNAPEDVKEFLINELQQLLKDEMEEAIICHLSYYEQNERLSLIKEKILKLTYNS